MRRGRGDPGGWSARAVLPLTRGWSSSGPSRSARPSARWGRRPWWRRATSGRWPGSCRCRAAGRACGELAVSSLAAALAAKADPVEGLPDLAAAPAVGWLVARPSNFAHRDTQAGGDPSELAATLARVMSPGAWVAVSLRAASRTEWGRARRWYEHRLAGVGDHYSRDGEVVVGSIFAGASSGAEVDAILLQLVAAIPGFDLDVAVRRAGRTAPAGDVGRGRSGRPVRGGDRRASVGVRRRRARRVWCRICSHRRGAGTDSIGTGWPGARRGPAAPAGPAALGSPPAQERADPGTSRRPGRSPAGVAGRVAVGAVDPVAVPGDGGRGGGPPRGGGQRCGGHQDAPGAHGPRRRYRTVGWLRRRRLRAGPHRRRIVLGGSGAAGNGGLREGARSDLSSARARLWQVPHRVGDEWCALGRRLGVRSRRNSHACRRLLRGVRRRYVRGPFRRRAGRPRRCQASLVGVRGIGALAA